MKRQHFKGRERRLLSSKTSLSSDLSYCNNTVTVQPKVSQIPDVASTRLPSDWPELCVYLLKMSDSICLFKAEYLHCICIWEYILHKMEIEKTVKVTEKIWTKVERYEIGNINVEIKARCVCSTPTLRHCQSLRLAHHHCNCSPWVADPVVPSSTWSLLHKKAFVSVKVLGSVFCYLLYPQSSKLATADALNREI